MAGLRGRRLSTILDVLGVVVWALSGLAAYVGLIPWALASLVGFPVYWALSRVASNRRRVLLETGPRGGAQEE